MCFLLFIPFSFWFYMVAYGRPEDLFSFDSNEPTGPISNDVDNFLLQSLSDHSNNDISPTDLVFNSANSINEYDAEPYNVEASNLFPDENHSVDTDSLLQSASACETDHRITWVDDGAPYLQARDGASCTPSKPKENIDSIMDIFQDPESFLRENIPPTKVPVGQTNQPKQNDENFNLEDFLHNRLVPLIFEEDGKQCPAEEFGLSITPVCLDSLKGSAIGSPGSWFTLHDVEPCRSRFHNTVVAGFCAR